jgi:hypothetical protein
MKKLSYLAILFMFGTIAPKLVLAQRLVFKVEVDGTKTLEQMVADGQYGQVNKDITKKNFRIRDQAKRAATIELLSLGNDISSEKIIKELNKAGYRPATIDELLALADSQPDLQRQFSIIALGSVWRGFSNYNFVVGLDHVGDDRELDVFFWGLIWDDSYRFAAVRK